MKKLSFLALAAVGLLFGACSDQDVVAESNPLEDAGVGYFKVSLNFPTVRTTRAWGESNETLQDGKDTEYAVDNAYIILFSGTTEANAKVIQVSQLTGSWANVTTTEPNQVTKKNEEVVTLSATAAAATNLWAMVVINSTGIIEPDGSTGVKINGVSKTDATLSDLQTEIAKATTYGNYKFINDDNHIFMTNAVLSDAKGGKSDPGAEPNLHILAPVNKLYIYEKKVDAQNGTPAADIYVERGVAKVTLNDASTFTVGTGISIKGGSAPTATFGGWCLDLVNSRSFIVRKVPAVETAKFAWNYNNAKSSDDKYRFIGNYPVDAEYGTASAGYRTYWALDPNYAAAAGTDLLSPAHYEKWMDGETEKQGALTAFKGDNNPQYCYENTFDVDHQSYKNTTSAVIKVTFSGGEFYTVGADRKTLYPESEVGTLIANVLMSLDDFKTWLDENHIQGVTKVTTSDLDIVWNTDAAGTVRVNNVTVKATAVNTATNISTITNGNNILSNVNAQVANIKRYAGGVSYYAVRIKHFGDDLTPWNSDELSTSPSESTIEKIYPGSGDARNAAYLGRYGVVRNNWYDIKVLSIVKIGAATPAELTETDHPDDELDDAYIKARINILSWAKRPQSTDLK